MLKLPNKNLKSDLARGNKWSAKHPIWPDLLLNYICQGPSGYWTSGSRWVHQLVCFRNSNICCILPASKKLMDTLHILALSKPTCLTVFSWDIKHPSLLVLSNLLFMAMYYPQMLYACVMRPRPPAQSLRQTHTLALSPSTGQRHHVAWTCRISWLTYTAGDAPKLAVLYCGAWAPVKFQPSYQTNFLLKHTVAF